MRLVDGHPLLAKFWGPLIGLIISALSFVYSIGNVPLVDTCGMRS